MSTELALKVNFAYNSGLTVIVAGLLLWPPSLNIWTAQKTKVEGFLKTVISWHMMGCWVGAAASGAAVTWGAGKPQVDVARIVAVQQGAWAIQNFMFYLSGYSTKLICAPAAACAGMAMWLFVPTMKTQTQP
mmetsp:Transcript_3137/g.4248  ORF Transcript_3137/g.4248 Transcript_3137/m.4248 type:complete len:132 (-) Transcript_3137:287-682(-)